MKYVDEFRDREKAKFLVTEIEGLVSQIPIAKDRPINLMEVCGGHTHSIFRYGIEGMLPKEIELVHGPGCPVCVLPMGRVDDCVAIAERPEVIFTTFGDAMRVPGSKKSLVQAKADGADVRMVYSPMDALALARKRPDREVVFFGIGFETTMPSTALTILQAEREGITNFSVFCNHITIVPTIKAILDSPDLQARRFSRARPCVDGDRDGALRIHRERYYRKPMVVAGFEPLDVLQSIWMVLRQIKEGRVEIENQYARIVPTEAATRRRLPPSTASTSCASISNGAGSARSIIPASGCATPMRASTRSGRFAVPGVKIADPASCQCGEVLKGMIKPWQCKVFGTACTPEVPLGALMVSPEGACAAYYQYGGVKRQARRGMNVVPLMRARPRGRVNVPTVTLAHGGGGKAMKDLIDDVFVGAFDNPMLAPLEDQARFDLAALAAPRRPARLHHRFLRRRSAVLSGRRHRQASRSAARSTISRSAARCRSISPAR